MQNGKVKQLGANVFYVHLYHPDKVMGKLKDYMESGNYERTPIGSRRRKRRLGAEPYERHRLPRQNARPHPWMGVTKNPTE